MESGTINYLHVAYKEALETLSNSLTDDVSNCLNSMAETKLSEVLLHLNQGQNKILLFGSEFLITDIHSFVSGWALSTKYEVGGRSKSVNIADLPIEVRMTILKILEEVTNGKEG